MHDHRTAPGYARHNIRARNGKFVSAKPIDPADALTRARFVLEICAAASDFPDDPMPTADQVVDALGTQALLPILRVRDFIMTVAGTTTCNVEALLERTGFADLWCHLGGGEAPMTTAPAEGGSTMTSNTSGNLTDAQLDEFRGRLVTALRALGSNEVRAFLEEVQSCSVGELRQFVDERLAEIDAIRQIR